jgi:hypothetical protein
VFHRKENISMNETTEIILRLDKIQIFRTIYEKFDDLHSQIVAAGFEGK